MDEMMNEEQESTLPPLVNGEIAKIESITVTSTKTKPPSRYTEGSLVMDMKLAGKFIEDDPALKKILNSTLGIGTAATRPTLIEELKSDKAFTKKGTKIYATPESEEMIKWLLHHAPQVADVKMSAVWEAKLNSFTSVKDADVFESAFREELVALTETLKSARPLATKGGGSTENRMSDSKPTDKMLEFAKNIATKVGVMVPDEVMSSYEECKKFIEAHKDAAMRPSEKQLNFANSIATSKGLQIPEAALKDGKELSKWIDANKG